LKIPTNNSKKVRLLFINPHAHHSFFTALALSKFKPVHILCPALSLQLWRGYWRRHDLHLATSSPREIYAQSLALFALLCFKAKWLTERTYLKIFRKAALIFLGKNSHKVVVYYQDYLYPALSNPHTNELRICELIIDSNSLQQNWSTTLAAASSADVVVAPTMAMAETLSNKGISLQLVPYGGDKRNYLASINRSEPTRGQEVSQSPYINTRVLRIAARANSHRKGADLLLEALQLLNERLIKFPIRSGVQVQITICGSLEDIKLDKLLRDIQKDLSQTRIISVTAKQFPQAQYLDLLAESDCFLMPSRLESSSLAALEALWHGIPSILSLNCGVEQFRSGEHGLILESLTSKTIADTLYKILCQPMQLEAWRSSLIKDRHLFSWNSYLNAYQSLLKNCILENPTRYFD